MSTSAVAAIAPRTGAPVNPVRMTRLLIIVTGAATLIGIFEWVHPRRDGHPFEAPADVVVDNTPDPHSTLADVIDILTTVTSDRNPFRLTREPSTVPYAPDRDGAPPPPPPPPKPPIAVSGIIGPPWVAVLEGVPAHEGSLLAKVGDTVSRSPFALLTIRAIRHDTVVVHAADTTWMLTVRHVWR
jgi:hypothetical protein